jgi:hypothetical protein
VKASEAIGRVPAIAGKARHRAERVAGQLPGALDYARVRAGRSVTRLQEFPDSELRLMAAASVGLVAGLRLAGASRLATLAGMAPASIFGFAIVSRRGRTRPAPHPASV